MRSPGRAFCRLLRQPRHVAESLSRHASVARELVGDVDEFEEAYLTGSPALDRGIVGGDVDEDNVADLGTGRDFAGDFKVDGSGLAMGVEMPFLGGAPFDAAAVAGDEFGFEVGRLKVALEA